MRLAVKTCGLNDPDAVLAAAEAGTDFAGFIFYPPSPRAVSPKEASEMAAMLPEDIHPVAVVVDMSDDELDALLAIFSPPFLQLHGSESPERVAGIRQRTGLQIIKAIPIGDPADVFNAIRYAEVADRLLLDAKPDPNALLPGGNGMPFDWNLLKGLELPIRWFLSGGLTIDNLAEAVHSTGARAVDASSALESGPGLKDPALIRTFVKTAHAIEI